MAEGSGGRTIASNWMFLRGFLTNWRQTGSLVPSSRYLSRAMLTPIDWRATRLAIELGPGTGVLTRDILKRLRKDAVLLAIEANPEFAAHLEKTILDNRLIIVSGDAAQLTDFRKMMGLGLADAVISSLPLRSLYPAHREASLAAAWASLAAGGSFVTYQYTMQLAETLLRFFPNLKRERLWRNWPPANVLYARKAIAPGTPALSKG